MIEKRSYEVINSALVITFIVYALSMILFRKHPTDGTEKLMITKGIIFFISVILISCISVVISRWKFTAKFMCAGNIINAIAVTVFEFFVDKKHLFEVPYQLILFLLMIPLFSLMFNILIEPR